MNHDITKHLDDRRAGRLHLPPREPGEPDRLPPPAAADAEGRLVRDAQRARAGEVEARALPARLDERGLRRSADPSAARDVLGQREPDRPARRLRRGEALRRGAHDGVPPPAGRRHVHRAHLQHVRAAHAPARRARDSDVRAPGACERAADRVRRRLADAKLLLRRRSRPRSRAARRERRASSGEHRQPARVHAARARAEGRRGHRLDERDRLRGAPGRRPARFASPTSHAPGSCWAGSRRSASRTACGECCKRTHGSH